MEAVEEDLHLLGVRKWRRTETSDVGGPGSTRAASPRIIIIFFNIIITIDLFKFLLIDDMYDCTRTRMCACVLINFLHQDLIGNLQGYILFCESSSHDNYT